MQNPTQNHEKQEKDPEAKRYDVLVLGSGEGGKYIAWSAASSGKKTALVERRYIGGSCPNIACLPSKNIVHSAKIVHTATQAAAFGLHPAPPGLDMKVVRGRKRAMVDELVKMHEEKFAKSGAELILGEGRFVAPKTIEVTTTGGEIRTLSGEKVVISTGSRAAIEPIAGLIEAKPLTHVEALELGEIPEHLIILGGGYIGLEFAQAFRRFGSRVTIVERNSRLLHRGDPDVSELLMQIFLDEGIELLTNAHLTLVSGRSGDQVTLHLEQNGQSIELLGTHLLVATGRTSNTDGIGLEAAGVEVTPTGFVKVDEQLRTTAPDVFAVGDCAGSPHFTHVAFDDYRIVRDALAGVPHTTTGRLVPSCLFVDPELAQVGLDETEAKRKGIHYRLVKIPMKDVLRTRTTGETKGFLKALISAENDTILGFTAFGASAGEMVAPVQLAMSSQLPYTALRNSVLTHPTFAEGLVYLFSATPTASV